MFFFKKKTPAESSSIVRRGVGKMAESTLWPLKQSADGSWDRPDLFVSIPLCLMAAVE
jgi:hypothetical protein